MWANQISTNLWKNLSVDTFDGKEVVLDERSTVPTDDRNCVSNAGCHNHRSVSLSFGFKKAPQCTNTVGQRKQMVPSAIDSSPLPTSKNLNCKLTGRPPFTTRLTK